MNVRQILASMVELARTNLMAMTVFALLDTKGPTAWKVSHSRSKSSVKYDFFRKVQFFVWWSASLGWPIMQIKTYNWGIDDRWQSSLFYNGIIPCFWAGDAAPRWILYKPGKGGDDEEKLRRWAVKRQRDYATETQGLWPLVVFPPYLTKPLFTNFPSFFDKAEKEKKRKILVVSAVFLGNFLGMNLMRMN